MALFAVGDEIGRCPAEVNVLITRITMTDIASRGLLVQCSPCLWASIAEQTIAVPDGKTSKERIAGAHRQAPSPIGGSLRTRSWHQRALPANHSNATAQPQGSTIDKSAQPLISSRNRCGACGKLFRIGTLPLDRSSRRGRRAVPPTRVPASGLAAATRVSSSTRHSRRFPSRS